MDGRKFTSKLLRWANPLLGQPPEMGALPQLYAAVSPDVSQGEFIGPDGPFQSRGYPTRARSNRKSHDSADMLKLWEESERLTGVRFAALA
jgi:hypothetical protein